ncbi:MAG: protein kinase domain-containing protein [Myxococcota bacterium]
MVCLVLALAAVGLAGPLPAAARESLGLAPSLTDASLLPVATGFDHWLLTQLHQAGVEAVPIEGVASLDEALTAAADEGLAHVLVPKMSARDGQASVQLLLYAPDSRVLLVGAGSEAPMAEFGNAAVEALARVVEQTGGASIEVTPPLLEDLARISQALLRWNEGDLAGAFRAVQGKLSPTAMALREEIADQARHTSVPATVRARLLVEMGDSTTAWTLVGRNARAALSKPDPDLDLLVAAGEVMFANDGVKEAREYFERALEIAPDQPDALAGLARVQAAQGDRATARTTLARAAAIDTDGVRFEEELARLEDDPARAAAHWVEAGRRAAKWLDVDRAAENFETAIETDQASTGRAKAAIGQLEEQLGRPAKARVAYRRAVGGGARTPQVLTALGRTEHRMGDSEAAATALNDALALDPKHRGAKRELSVVYTDTGRAAEAVPLLREVHAIDPSHDETRLTLARALRATGDTQEALALLSGEEVRHQSQALFQAAEIQAEQGDLEAARVSLERAVELEPGDASLRDRLAVVLDKLGDAAGAVAERQLAAALNSGRAEESGGKHDPQRGAASVLSLDDLVMSFAMQLANPESRSIVSLGVQEPDDWNTRLLKLVRPRSPDITALERGLSGALQARFQSPMIESGTDEALAVHIERLFDFESDLSLDAETIATVNEVLAVDGTFVTRLVVHKSPELAEACAGDAFAVETRLLLGRASETASILSNTDCLDGGFAAYGKWNYLAFVLYLLGGLIVAWPVIRGWGQLVVKIQVPERTNGFFSIHVTKRPDAVKREIVGDRSEKAKSRTFDFLMRYQRHMAGAETTFKFIPARQLPYTVTVSGPLKDARGEEIIGHFLEEQRVTVRRRRVSTLDFDFRPKEVAVEVTVKENGQPIENARVGIQGDPSSLRYARDGMAYLYLGLGDYTILVGSDHAAACFDISITSLDTAIPLQAEMSREEGIVFSQCPEAVEPYLQSDLATAAAALERAGNERAAHMLRADLYRQQGKNAEAARELEAAGEIGGAALELAGGDDFQGSAALYEEAGDMDHAARAFRDAGDFQKAAECFEKVYDWANAVECWREVGDSEREMYMLEKLGEFMEAAQIARQMGDREQVIRLLQHIEPRHAEYPQACMMIGELASEQGDHDIAVAKFEEALSSTGVESASIETLESYAKVLEAAGRRQEALSAYEAIRRQDVARTDVATRIEALKREISASEGQTQRVTSGSGGATAGPVESRYELMEEIGRGGLGVVYKARDKRLGRVVALKRLPDNLRDHPAAVQLFEREARAAAALNHVNIVTIFDAGEENGTYFITMELLEGRPLNAILEARGRVGVRDTMRLGIQICAGLHYAHERKIVHRDIKTANLFFTKEQVVKIMDFGIAKSLEEVRRSTTVVGGTPYYMAPEQAAGEAVDHRTDLYALGVTLFQLCTGHLPFEDGDVSYQHRHEAPPDPRELEVNVTPELAQVILELMEKSPDDRPANAAVVGVRLGELLAQIG